MDSDSDRTIDSDELESIIAKQKQLTSGNESSLKKNLKRHSNLHEISESDSDEELQIKKKFKKWGNNKASISNKAIAHISESDSDEDLKIEKNFKKHENNEISNCNDKRPLCKYGKNCYRKNPDHMQNFYHPGESLVDLSCNHSSEQKFKNVQINDYFNFYLTKVEGIPTKFNVGFALDVKDILSSKNGKLLSSVQFNYMFDVSWMMKQYPNEFRKCPLIIVHGEQRASKIELEKSAVDYPNIKFCQAKLDIPFGTHHTKMMFLLYEEGLRIVIHTSNMIANDWCQKTQGIWLSPILPELKSDSSSKGESPTNFKADLLEYVSSYKSKELDEWSRIIQKHDFSQIKVILIGSVPGRHLGSKKTAFGHLKLRKIFYSSGSELKNVFNWSVVGQFSSIGSLGSSPDQWLTGEFSASLSTTSGNSISVKPSDLKLVYPCVENVRKSLEGYPAGASLPYSIKVAQKQPYLKTFLHQWKSDKYGRSEASPHIKSYFRLSPDASKIAWFLVTSANLSKAAWGALEKKATQFMIRSYEIGVLFLPKNFGLEYFTVSDNDSEICKRFPVPFDIPLEPYSKQDEPWIWDIPHVYGPDRYGNMWCPP